MTQEDKQLLLRDLCMRLPYGVKVWNSEFLDPIEEYHPNETLILSDLDFYIKTSIEVKPYLRPMSSMTKEEEEEYELLIDCSDYTYFKTSDKVIDWLNKHYFDYRIDPSTGKTLIESGLAIEAPEGMYKTD